MNYQVTFHLTNYRTIQRKANERDRAMITGDWNLDPATRFVSFNFEHRESPPVAINLDVLEYIDFRKL